MTESSGGPTIGACSAVREEVPVSPPPAWAGDRSTLCAMDAGLAAVLGAVAGAVATFVTGRTSRDQAQFAAKVEHVRQRREGRELAYRGFVSAAAKVRDLYLDEVWGGQTPGAFVAAVSELEDRWLDVTLAVIGRWGGSGWASAKSRC